MPTTSINPKPAPDWPMLTARQIVPIPVSTIARTVTPMIVPQVRQAIIQHPQAVISALQALQPMVQPTLYNIMTNPVLRSRALSAMKSFWNYQVPVPYGIAEKYFPTYI
jgi:hypothetical protein